MFQVPGFMSLIRKIIPEFLISWYHFKLAFLGALIYGFPSRKLKVIGVTGTSGKSTVVDLTAIISEEAGYKAASLSSIKFKIGQKEWKNTLKMTMPGRFKIQKFLRQAVKAGCQYAVLEVTSEGIKQHRHRFINFDTAVFTNLTPEHIERHGSFEKYREAKGKLFQTVKNIHIINIDDKNADYFLRFPSYQKFCYGANKNLDIEKLKIDWKLKSSPPGSPPASVQENCKFIKTAKVNKSSTGIDFIIENTPFHLNLLGGFNAYNALAAICVGLSQGIDLETCKKALEKIEGIPGRMEVVIRKPFVIIVDYAHTPDSLKSVYKTLSNPKSAGREADSPEGCIRNPKQTQNSNVQNSKLICVLSSAGGGRDKWKRPELGKIAAQYCDQIILTDEDPYDENPAQIIEEIYKGTVEEIRVNPRSYPRKPRTFSPGEKVRGKSASIHKILDRREAIKKALELARPGDTVIITGKGCESWMCIEKGKKIPWDDRKIVREEFDKL